jgi:putative ABC transport system substrate-binding protein
MKNWAQYPLRVVLGLILVLGGIYAGYRAIFPDLPLVGVIEWTREIKAFEESLQGVTEGLREEGFQDGLNIRLVTQDAHGQRAEAAAASRDFQKKGARLLITLGTVPTLIALETTKTPLVYTAVGSPKATGLSRPAAGKNIRFTGTSMEVSIQEQLRFLLMARPGLKRLGILFCNATPQAVATGEEAEKVSRRMGLTPFLHMLTDDRQELLTQAFTYFLNQRIEALFIPTDPVLGQPKNLRVVCDFTRRSFIPVIVPTGDSVPYGPLMAYAGDFMEMGRQAGRQAAQFLKGVPMDRIPPESPNIKRLTINLKAAQDLGCLLPRQLLCQANQLYQ